MAADTLGNDTCGRRPRADPWQHVAVVALGLAVAAFLVHEIYSLDVWWQVAIGRDIIETRTIPHVDRYAVAALDRPYHDSHWLFQVVLGLTHSIAGMVGVQLSMIALWCVTLVVCFIECRRWVAVTPAAVLTFLICIASTERFLARPEIVTYAGIALLYHMLRTRRYHTPLDLAGLALLQVVWSNSHGLFVIGPFMLGCYLLPSGVAWARGRASAPLASLRAFGVVLLASGLTPYGFAGWRYAALVFREAGASASEVVGSLGELSDVFGAPARTSPAFWSYLLLLLAAGLAAIVQLHRRKFSPRGLIVAGLCAASLTGRRNVVLLALVAGPFVAECLSGFFPLRGKIPRWISVAAAVPMAAAAWFPLSGSYYLRMEIPARWGIGVTPSFFPHALPEFLEKVGFDGQVLNSNTLGGFYLYHGYPRRLPLTDGRWEVYEPTLLRELLAASRDRVGWRRLAAGYEITGLLLAHTSPEARAVLPDLAGSTGWRLVYLDCAASFWMSSLLPTLPPSIDLDDPQVLPVPTRPDDGLLLHAFLSAVGARVAEMANLQTTLRFGVREAQLLERLGSVQLKTGRLQAARTTFEALLEEEPRNEIALNELGFLAYANGNLERAADLMRKLVEIAPQEQRYQENYRLIQKALHDEDILKP